MKRIGKEENRAKSVPRGACAYWEREKRSGSALLAGPKRPDSAVAQGSAFGCFHGDAARTRNRRMLFRWHGIVRTRNPGEVGGNLSRGLGLGQKFVALQMDCNGVLAF